MHQMWLKSLHPSYEFCCSFIHHISQCLSKILPFIHMRYCVSWIGNSSKHLRLWAALSFHEGKLIISSYRVFIHALRTEKTLTFIFLGIEINLLEISNQPWTTEYLRFLKEWFPWLNDQTSLSCCALSCVKFFKLITTFSKFSFNCRISLQIPEASSTWNM